MATIKVKDNQSMLDVILTACGTLEGGMEFCALNGVAISDIPEVDTVYQVPVLSGDILKKGSAILKYYSQNEVEVGTLEGDVPEVVLATEDGDVITTEDGFAIEIES